MMLGITMINTAVHAVMIAILLISSSAVYLRRRGCGWRLASGSYTRRGTSFSKPPPDEGNGSRVSRPSACAREGDTAVEALRRGGVAGVRGCSRRLFGGSI